MSRTFRRKNYEETKNTSWARKGRKTAGFYTESDYSYYIGYYNFREPTKQEYYDEYYRIHGESHAGDWTPNRWFRHNRMKENRSINKQEMIKFFKNPDNYEPMFEDKVRDCWWDWD